MYKIFRNNIPRWIIYLFDITTALFALIVAYLLRFNFDIPSDEIPLMPTAFITLFLVRTSFYFIYRTYSGIIRYTSTEDAARIFLSVISGSAFIVLANILRYYLFDGKFLIPFSIVGIEFLATTFALITFRIGVKVFYMELKNPTKDRQNVIIYGAGEAGVITKRAIDRDGRSKLRVVGFIDDDKKKESKQIEQVKIFHSSKLLDLIEKYEPTTLIISTSLIKEKNRQEIIDICLQHDITVLSVPPINTWINGELSFKQIKAIKIDDLLGRKQINLDTEKVEETLLNKVVLVTGAAGSIGSEIVRQLHHFNPSKVILLDIAESALYELENELKNISSTAKAEVVIGDVRNEVRMRNVFKTFKPQIVFHAAAYKHVPLMENNPSESVGTNILGTKVVADLSDEFNVEKFVFISTDKAVNPTNVMGASKRFAELYVQDINQNSKTQYIVTRFGNVLGSNGSVIPLFKKQIEKGGPITVTHPDITRYFMTIPEACQLVLQAGTYGTGGEVFVFDMGKSVKIVDLAKKMVKLSGLKLGKDIQIVFTGLRPGEKLYEELLANDENTLPTPYDQIMIAKVHAISHENIENAINNLKKELDSQDNMKLVEIIKSVVEEYKSENSEFKVLDGSK